MIESKVEYLAKTFSRTRRKDYENYILNAVWQKIGSLNARPVSQQYVKGEDNKYFMIDLYFPQLNIGIEVDEAFHKHTVEHDLRRELTIEQKLSSVRKDKFFKLYRIDATLPLDKLTLEIEAVAKEIREKMAENNINQWDTDLSIKDHIEDKGFISIDDFYRFRKITDVANLVFFKDYKGYQQSTFKVEIDGQMEKVWFPTISTKAKAEHEVWFNYLNDDWSVLTEVNNREDGKTGDHDHDELRIIFAKIRDNYGKLSYRYIGNFRLKVTSADKKEREYHKVSDRLYVNYESESITMLY